MREGAKNSAGSYYTPKKIAKKITSGFELRTGKSFFDPCCGSGAFLLGVDVADSRQFFGVDVDPVAVMIAKINLLLKYPTVEFAPQIFYGDYLRDAAPGASSPIFQQKFDYIASNPP